MRVRNKRRVESTMLHDYMLYGQRQARRLRGLGEEFDVGSARPLFSSTSWALLFRWNVEHDCFVVRTSMC